MRFYDYFRTALKNLLRQKLRSFLTIFAIVIGALSVIIMLSLILGAKNVFMKQLQAMGALTMATVTADPDSSDLNGGGNINGASDSKKLDDTLAVQLSKLNNVVAVSPSIGLPFNKMHFEGQTKKTWPRVVAYDPKPAFDKEILAGRNLKKGDLAKIIVTTGFLKVYANNTSPPDAIGKKVIFEANGWYSGYGVDPIPPVQCDKQNDCEDQQAKLENKITPIPVEIVGVAGGMDESNFVTLDFAKQTWIDRRYETRDCGGFDRNSKQDLPCEPTLTTTNQIDKKGYGSIIMKVDKTENVKGVAAGAKKLGLEVVTAQEMIDEIMKIFTMVGLVLGTIGGIALFVAAIGIINTMIMATYERTREIGVMRACGATRATVRRLFTFEAAMLGFWGGIFGLILSFILAKIGNLVAGNIAVDQSIPIEGIITFPLWLIACVIGFTTLIGLLAGLYPAYRASRLDPVEALRYE